MSEFHKPGVAVLVSGGGSTVEAFIHATQDGRVDAEVGLVVCSKPPEDAGVYDRIDRLNRQYSLDIETVEINARTHPDGKAVRGQTDAESAAICEKVAESRFAHVALMGYMLIVRGELMQEYGWLPHFSSIYEARMSNTHPGPLPETADTHEAGASSRVLELGLGISKHTVHLVAPGVDTGPKLAEHPVEVLPGDSPQDLFARVQIAEKTGLPYAIDKFLREQRAYRANQ